MDIAGVIALLLFLADDEEHAKRAFARMATWEAATGWGVLEQAKRGVAETRA